MEAPQPLQPKPNPARHAKSLNRLVGIARTRRLVAAASREQNGQIRFVEPEREERDPHACMGARICRGGACSARWCGAKRRIPGSCWAVPPGMDFKLFRGRHKIAAYPANSAVGT